MSFREMLDSMNLEKRKQERAAAARNCAVSICVAATAGVVVGILFAPKSGKETREELKNKCFKSCTAMKDTLHQKVEMARDYAADTEQKATDIVKDVAEKTEAVKKTLKESSQAVKEDVQKTIEKVSDELNKPVK